MLGCCLLARNVFLVVSRQLVQQEEQTPETLLQWWEVDAELQERYGGEVMRGVPGVSQFGFRIGTGVVLFSRSLLFSKA